MAEGGKEFKEEEAERERARSSAASYSFEVADVTKKERVGSFTRLLHGGGSDIFVLDLAPVFWLQVASSAAWSSRPGADCRRALIPAAGHSAANALWPAAGGYA
jgi:hypothetical protein